MQWIAKHSWKIALAVIALSALVEIAIALHAGPNLWYQDERDYVALSKNLVQRHQFTLDGVHPTASRPPGYIWFLALPQFFGASNTTLRLFNASALIFSQLFVFLLARRVSSDATAAIAVLLSLAYPVLFYSATVLFPQTLAAALLLCGIWLLLDKKPLTMWKAIFAGTVWAALILTVPTFLILAGAFSLWLFWRRRDFRRMALPFAAPVVILLAGWSVRNYIAFRTPVFIATNSGVNLLLGNSENVTADSGSSADISRYTAKGWYMSEPERNKYYSDSAKKWVKEHPAQAVHLYGAKLLHYFGFADKTTADDRSTALSDGDHSWREVIMVVTYGPLLLLFLARIASSTKFPMSQEEICLAGLYLVNALFASVFFARIRFRLPMDWLLFVIGAGMISLIVSRFSSESRIASHELNQLNHSREIEESAASHEEIVARHRLNSDRKEKAQIWV
ncbi:MAG TPA: glycosyltransferase family 39 protein [Silvibacterium sp.]|nr:glycosyltransferase family 39 protein [Silvibacterium sp.]